MARILLCEDDDLIGTMVALMLQGEGHDVARYCSAEAAMAAVSAGPAPELYVLDVNLPGRDGVSLAAELRARGESTPVLRVTALADTAAKVRALDAGADDHLAKPFDMPELLARVRALLRRAERGAKDPR